MNTIHELQCCLFLSPNMLLLCNHFGGMVILFLFQPGFIVVFSPFIWLNKARVSNLLLLCKNCMGEGIIYFAVVSESITCSFLYSVSVFSFTSLFPLSILVHLLLMIAWASVCCVSFIVQPLHWLHQDIQWLLCSFCKNLHEYMSNQKTLNAQKIVHSMMSSHCEGDNWMM